MVKNTNRFYLCSNYGDPNYKINLYHLYTNNNLSE